MERRKGIAPALSRYWEEVCWVVWEGEAAMVFYSMGSSSGERLVVSRVDGGDSDGEGMWGDVVMLILFSVCFIPTCIRLHT